MPSEPPFFVALLRYRRICSRSNRDYSSCIGSSSKPRESTNAWL